MNQELRSYRAKRRGFTLTEIAIVLGIVGLILGAIWVAAAAVYNNLRTSRATNELLTMAQNVRALYATAATIGDAAGKDETDSFQRAGVFPGDMVVSSGATTIINNPWSGTVMITSQKANNDGDSFGIEFNSVPTAACIVLLTSNTGSGRDTGLYFASASASAQGAAAYGTTATTFPVSASTAAGGGTAICSAAAKVSVQFAFRLKS